MSVVQAENARRGGREARRALRAAPLALNERPVWPGMNGGAFRPMSEADLQRIHQAALDVLEQIGFADAIPSGIEAMTRVGAKLGSNGRLTFPARAGRGHHRDGGAQVPAARPGSEVRHGAVGQEGLFRHRRRRRAHRRSDHRRISREHDQGPLRHRAHRRRDGAHPFLPARRGVPRPARSVRDGFQHLLRQRDGHSQACRRELGRPASTCRLRSRCCT